MRIQSFIRLIFIAPLLCAVPAFGQQPQQRPSPSSPPQEQEKPEVIYIRRVRLPITVTDKKNQFVPGLTRDDFMVLEDKVQQQIETFSTEEQNTNEPLYVAMLVDTSPSVAGKLKFEQEAAMNFIQDVLRPRKDRVLFATFDDQITLRQDFTDRLDLLDRAIFGLKKPGKQTALYDAIWQFCNEKMRSAQGRRALVVVTDGEDTYSRADLRDAIDIAQRTETTVYAISTKAGFSATVPGVEAGQVKDKADRELTRLCDETGGTALFTGDMLALERAFNRISKELRSQYLITYKPTNDRYDGNERHIEVKLTNGHQHLRLRTKKGYKAVADNVRPTQ
jgi:VWFA-related protein